MSCCWQRSAASLREEMPLPALSCSTTPYHVPSTSPRSFKKVQRSLFKIRLEKKQCSFLCPSRTSSIYDDRMRADLPRTRYLIWRKVRWRVEVDGSLCDLMGSTACTKHPVFLDRSGAPKPHTAQERVPLHCASAATLTGQRSNVTWEQSRLGEPREAGWYTLNP